jgi:hypothetical protein
MYAQTVSTFNILHISKQIIFVKPCLDGGNRVSETIEHGYNVIEGTE